jgi:hypothetical protein
MDSSNRLYWEIAIFLQWRVPDIPCTHTWPRRIYFNFAMGIVAAIIAMTGSAICVGRMVRNVVLRDSCRFHH